jgi:hypothetical protein
MSEDPPEVQWEEDVPDERPPAGGGESEVDDEPLGVPEEGESKTGPLPGMPESEPPSSG